MSPSDDGGYVHDPSRFGEDGERLDGIRPDVDRQADGTESGAPADVDAGEAGGERDDWVDRPINPIEADRSFDWRGWVLVGVVVIAFVVAPLGILLYPPGGDSYWFTLIVFPLLPALLLAITAVWATTRP